MSDPNAAPEDKGDGSAGTSDDKPKWQELGFSSEDALHDAAQEATGLRNKIATADEAFEKEKTSREKTDSAYMRQSTKLGEVTKSLKEAEAKLVSGDGKPSEKSGNEVEDEVKDTNLVESLSEDEVKRYDEILEKPENVELKKAVVKGGVKAMAEFIRSLNESAPLDFKAPVFASVKRKKDDGVKKSSIANMVKKLFEDEEDKQRNKLPASQQSGAPSDNEDSTRKPNKIGQVGVEFFKKEQ